jgi:hypothetical protein
MALVKNYGIDFLYEELVALMIENEVIYYLLILKKYVIVQGAFDASNADNKIEYVLMFAECNAHILSAAFGVFLLFITIHCRSPPSISL